jgi:hypothetical protein
MVKNPAIVIVTFNRPKSLERLLMNIAQAHYEDTPVDLVISIDFQDSDSHSAVTKLAREFEWSKGSKHIIEHSTNLGLRAHVLSCGDLTSKYDSIIMLEDDLVVSRFFYDYTSKALNFYDNEEEIAGISLYNHKRNFLNGLPFELLGDHHDNYFLQIASSWGQAWTKKQWSSFKSWYEQNLSSAEAMNQTPRGILNWPESSWLKYFIRYLVSQNKYFVYPKISYSSNFGDSGTHNKRNNSDYQVPLSITDNKEPRFAKLSDSVNVYDSYFELCPEILRRFCPGLNNIEFTVDLQGLKHLASFALPYAISSKRLKNSNFAEKTFGLNLKPVAMNIICDAAGNHFALAKIEDFDSSIGIKRTSSEEWLYFFGPARLKIMSEVVLKELKSKLIK